MGAIVFDNMQFDYWLTQKSQEILSKADKEKITTEDLIILTLKAQTNHFDHMDQDMKKGISDLGSRMDHLENRIDRVENRLDRIEIRVDSLDKKIDNRFMWMIGVTIAMSGGIYLKLFLG